MATIRSYLLTALIVMTLMSRFQVVSAQQNAVSMIDTSEYLPDLYEGSLDYNLLIAASNGYTTEIKRLIDRGADVNAATAEGVTSIMYAVLNNNLEEVNTILKFNPLLDVMTFNSETPLLMAVKNNFFDIAEALIRAGADVDYPDRNGATPLHYAAINGYFDIADLLLYYNAAADEKSDDGETPLHAAIMAGFANITDLLIQNGANMEARNKDGFTPFLIATINGDTLIMDLLHKNGVDIYAVNNASYSALDLSISANQMDAARYLLRIGNKWGEVEKNAISPYKVAGKYRRTEVVKLLKENKIPGQISYAIDQSAFTLSTRFVSKDIYTGLSISLKEPYLNGGLVAGCDLKLWYTRVLIKETENRYYQYWDKGYLFYGGIFKDFIISEHPLRSNLALSGSLIAGYSFGHMLKGSGDDPENEFHVIPSLALKWNIRSITTSIGAEYIKSQFYHNGPVWIRAGLSYTLFFDKVRTQIKPIKWY